MATTKHRESKLLTTFAIILMMWLVVILSGIFIGHNESLETSDSKTEIHDYLKAGIQ